jgi:hypothetical protein
MPSRQAQRAAARRAFDEAEAGAGGAAAALASPHLHPTPLGDWSTQMRNPSVMLKALGAETLRRKAEEGDRDAQFSQARGPLTASSRPSLHLLLLRGGYRE